jgi:hypothetical protein
MLIKKFWISKEVETIIQREGTQNWKQLASILPGRVRKQYKDLDANLRD